MLRDKWSKSHSRISIGLDYAFSLFPELTKQATYSFKMIPTSQDAGPIYHVFQNFFNQIWYHENQDNFKYCNTDLKFLRSSILYSFIASVLHNANLMLNAKEINLHNESCSNFLRFRTLPTLVSPRKVIVGFVQLYYSFSSVKTMKRSLFRMILTIGYTKICNVAVL